MQFLENFVVSVVLLCTASMSYVLACYFLIFGRRGWKISNYFHTSLQPGDFSVADNSSTVREKLSIALVVLSALFPTVYYMSMAGIISDDFTAIMFIVVNIFMNLIFSTIAVEMYTHMIYDGYVVQVRTNIYRQSFLRYILHEVRVPLSSISMGIDSLLFSRYNDDNVGDSNETGAGFGAGTYRRRTEDDNETLGMMREATEFMGDTLNSMLNMQKIEEGKFELSMAMFYVRDAVEKVTKSLRGAFSLKKIKLSVAIQKYVDRKVLGDHFQIEHVLANFCSNAIKFSKEGAPIEISVSAVQKDTEHIRFHSYTFIRFSVRDCGPGIGVEDQKRLFQPFMQIRPQELQNGGGSGVGLHICKQIVELHGGWIGCESVEGEGSTFFFVVPFQSDEGTEADQAPVGRDLVAISINMAHVQNVAEYDDVDQVLSRIEAVHMSPNSSELEMHNTGVQEATADMSPQLTIRRQTRRSVYESVASAGQLRRGVSAVSTKTMPITPTLSGDDEHPSSVLIVDGIYRICSWLLVPLLI